MFFCWISSGENGFFLGTAGSFFCMFFYGAIIVFSFFIGARHVRVYVILVFSRGGGLVNDTD